MTRPTSSGFPFLVARSDSRKFAYWRNIKSEVVPFLEGKLELSWSSTAYLVDKKPVIKISLKTGDSAQARRRWAEVHQQVENCLERANVAANKQLAPAGAAMPSLTSGDRAAIAAQARHDVMADHDADWADPNALSPLARGLQQALKMRDSGQLPTDREKPVDPFFASLIDFVNQFPRGMTTEQIREAARTIEANSIAEMFASRRAWPLDAPNMLVEEIVADPDSPNGERVVATFSLASELTARLGENGFNLRDASERKKVAHSVLMAKAAAHQDIEMRNIGKAIETPPRPAPMVSDGARGTYPTLLEMHDIWVKNARPGDKATDDNKLYIERFISKWGNLRVNEITRKHIREFRNDLEKFPSAMPAHIAKKSFAEIIQWAEKNDPPRLSRITVNAKGLGSLSAVMRIAVKDYELPGDPSSELCLPVDESDSQEIYSYTPELLQRLRKSPVFQNPPVVPKAGHGAAAFWLPLIGLYTGARLEEIGQLPLTDILEEAGITYFWFRETDDETDSQPRRRQKKQESLEKKSIKSKAGRRRVPLHRALIELGLLEYIAARRAAGDKMLFPQLKPYRRRFTKNWSKWWGRYQDEHITADPAFVFHSLRHTFIGAMRNKKVPKDFMKAIVGHARELDLDLSDAADVTDNYGEAAYILLINEHVQKIEYKGLLFERIEAFLK